MPYQDTGVFPIREDPGILIFCSLNRSEACIAPLKLMLPRGRSPADMLLGIVKVVGHNIRQQAIPVDLPNEDVYKRQQRWFADLFHWAFVFQLLFLFLRPRRLGYLYKKAHAVSYTHLDVYKRQE